MGQAEAHGGNQKFTLVLQLRPVFQHHNPESLHRRIDLELGDSSLLSWFVTPRYLLHRPEPGSSLWWFE